MAKRRSETEPSATEHAGTDVPHESVNGHPAASTRYTRLLAGINVAGQVRIKESKSRRTDTQLIMQWSGEYFRPIATQVVWHGSDGSVTLGSVMILISTSEIKASLADQIMGSLSPKPDVEVSDKSL